MVINLQETALEFLKYFCEGDIEQLSALLDDDFQFKGPLIECDSKESYIASLEEDPPKDISIELSKIFENEGEVCLLYSLTKPKVTTPMAQYFRFNDGKITETLLIFDSGAFQ